MMLGPKQRFGLLNGKRKRAQEKLIKPSNSRSLRAPNPLKGALHSCGQVGKVFKSLPPEGGCIPADRWMGKPSLGGWGPVGVNKDTHSGGFIYTFGQNISNY